MIKDALRSTEWDFRHYINEDGDMVCEIPSHNVVIVDTTEGVIVAGDDARMFVAYLLRRAGR